MEKLIRKVALPSNESFTETADRPFTNVFTESTEVNKWKIFLQVGVITATHGIRGEVKVFPTTDDPERFLDLETVYLDTGREKKLLTISSVKFFKQFVILKFKEFDNINDVEPFEEVPSGDERPGSSAGRG